MGPKLGLQEPTSPYPGRVGLKPTYTSNTRRLEAQALYSGAEYSTKDEFLVVPGGSCLYCRTPYIDWDFVNPEL